MVKVKICGLTTPEDVQNVNRFGADYAGFILFFPKSKRNLSLEKAKALLDGLADSVIPVAVTVSPTPEQATQIQEAGFRLLQVHGTLEDGVLETCRIPILRALNIQDAASFDDTKLPPGVTGVVLDGAIPGNGKCFDWKLSKDFIAGLGNSRTVFLAGGLHAGNVREAIEELRPDVVDVSSGVENAEGNGKDAEKIQAFINTAKNIAERNE